VAVSGPDIKDLSQDVRDRIEAATELAGFTPNVFRAYGYRPAHFRASSPITTGSLTKAS
jgi:hypothetical protein